MYQLSCRLYESTGTPLTKHLTTNVIIELDENGKEVYGSMNVDKEYAVQQGMSGYARDLTAAQSNARVTNSPVSVKGLKTEGAGRSDIVIANADAEKIRASGDNQSFLKKCRVMIVLD